MKPPQTLRSSLRQLITAARNNLTELLRSQAANAADADASSTAANEARGKYLSFSLSHVATVDLCILLFP
jgi:hypothetical protein